MSRVEVNETNKRHCRCPHCPVQMASDCAKGNPGFLFCAVGKTKCDDFDTGERCICPSCLVWDENNLRSVYYCANGSADDID